MDRAPGLTLDTGALIAVERGKRRAVTLIKAAVTNRLAVTIPTVCVAEAWRGSQHLSPLARDLYDSADRDELGDEEARAAGEALARTGESNAIDAIVMASAARRGDRVLTGDRDDLELLREHFPEVRVLTV